MVTMCLLCDVVHETKNARFHFYDSIDIIAILDKNEKEKN
jgi:hypothetical protein